MYVITIATQFKRQNRFFCINLHYFKTRLCEIRGENGCEFGLSIFMTLKTDHSFLSYKARQLCVNSIRSFCKYSTIVIYSADSRSNIKNQHNCDLTYRSVYLFKINSFLFIQSDSIFIYPVELDTLNILFFYFYVVFWLLDNNNLI